MEYADNRLLRQVVLLFGRLLAHATTEFLALKHPRGAEEFEKAAHVALQHFEEDTRHYGDQPNP